VLIAGFIIRIYHDARSPEGQIYSRIKGLNLKPIMLDKIDFISKNKFRELVLLAGFIIRIYHDAGHLKVKYIHISKGLS
jgi:hypothetical protein